jgi:putative tryptophan/tyrosine transport system substrate-binding protein
MASYIGRRKFLATLLGGVAVAWPLAARAQQPAMPVVGLLSGIEPDARQLAAFRQGLNEVGYIAGKSVTIDHRSAAGQYGRLPALANDLVRRRVTVIVTILGPRPPQRLFQSSSRLAVTRSKPLVPSLNRPGGNVTGVTFLSNVLAAKRLGLLRELVPGISAVGDLVNPTNPNSAGETNDMQTAAQSLGLELRIVNASTEREIDAAFANFAEQRLKALIVTADAFFSGRRDQLVSLAARHALPTMYWLREFVADGGLMSYGTSITDAFRAAGVYAGRVLKGERPADLPVVQSTKFELVINLKAAQTLGVTIPPGVLAIADEVVE